MPWATTYINSKCYVTVRIVIWHTAAETLVLLPIWEVLHLRRVPETNRTQIFCAFTQSLWKVLKHHLTANQNQLFLYHKDILTISFSKLQHGWHVGVAVIELRWSVSNQDKYTAWKTWYSLLVYIPPLLWFMDYLTFVGKHIWNLAGLKLRNFDKAKS